MQWKRNNKNSFIEHLICPRHLISSLTYLNTQRQVLYQAKAVLLLILIILWLRSKIFFFILKLMLSTSTLQWLKALWMWKRKQNRLSYLFHCLPWEIRTTHFKIWKTRPEATCVQSVIHHRTWTQVSHLLLPAYPTCCSRIAWEHSCALTVLYTSRGLEEGTHKLQCPARSAGGVRTCSTVKEHSVLGTAKDKLKH